MDAEQNEARFEYRQTYNLSVLQHCFFFLNIASLLTGVAAQPLLPNR